MYGRLTDSLQRDRILLVYLPHWKDPFNIMFKKTFSNAKNKYSTCKKWCKKWCNCLK